MRSYGGFVLPFMLALPGHKIKQEAPSFMIPIVCL